MIRKDNRTAEDPGEADLHTHTYVSDGIGSPASNVRGAKEAGLAAVAITDHDAVGGLAEAEEEGRRIGIIVVPGVEISTVAEGIDVHVLGYYYEANELFLSRLEELRDVRDKRNQLMLLKLQELGVPITMEEVIAAAGPGKKPDESVGRPHFADVLIAKGIVADRQEAFDRYLGTGGAAYVNPPRIRPEDAIRYIHEAGGAAVLAHPGLYHNDTLVEHLAVHGGLDGIEAYHSDHSREESERYEALANREGLVVTAGSDFHGEKNGEVFHGPIGSRRISVAVLTKLQERAASHRASRA